MFVRSKQEFYLISANNNKQSLFVWLASGGQETIPVYKPRFSSFTLALVLSNFRKNFRTLQEENELHTTSKEMMIVKK